VKSRELGITEKILQAPPGTYVLRKDYSGLDVVPIVGLKVEADKPPEGGPPRQGKNPKS
jgi:hypothetical protein